MNSYLVKRNSDGLLIENCTVNVGIKIGSFDCTANCSHNKNTKKEIQEQAFDLKEVKCSMISNSQLTIEL